ncbi:MAG TPA: nitroreductase family protein [Stellaceae bacterium]|nr:nitroreductase family protein [Stellaceae bacterium]
MSPPDDDATRLRAALERRFGEAPDFESDVAPRDDRLAALSRMAAHATCRDFSGRPVDPTLIRLLCAVALSAPTKSDLQQRDIIVIEDGEQRRRLDALVPPGGWPRQAPALLVFCGNSRRQRQLHLWRGHGFANDHLDAFFNAAVDAGIALAAFVIAAEAVGLGTCPVSAFRNRAQAVSDTLALPDHVFPVAGLALGWPSGAAAISPRLPLAATIHTDRFDDGAIANQVAAYDARRASLQPYAKQRGVAEFGEAASYGWSEDKARQYAKPERADFGEFVRRKGFNLR